MSKRDKCQAPVRLELSGGICDSISRIASGMADLAEVFFLSLAEIVLAWKDMVVRRLQRH
jgi:hypothetical protein